MSCSNLTMWVPSKPSLSDASSLSFRSFLNPFQLPSHNSPSCSPSRSGTPIHCGLRELRGRIDSVKNTQKITEAMKLVAAAKVRRAQEAVVNGRPFSETLVEVLYNINEQLQTEDIDAPLTNVRPVKKVALVVVTGDRGLCGSFNNSIIKKAEARIAELKGLGLDYTVISVGKKGNTYFLRRPYIPVDKFIEGNTLPTAKEAQALSADPLMWAAYEELCVLGAAEEAAAVFGEAAALCIQKQYLPHGASSQSLHMSNEDRGLSSSGNFGPGADDASPRQLKHMQGNNQKDIPGNYHGATALGGAASQPSNGVSSNISFYNTPSPMASQLSGVAPPPLCRNAQPNGPNQSIVTVDSSPRSTVNSTIQAPRRKFVDEGKLRKISGRLFSDSGPRRSTRLSGDAGANSNVSATMVVGNGTSNSSKYLGGSKLSSMAFRAVTIRKVQSWTNENIDEGIRNETFDDSRTNVTSTTSSLSPSGDTRSPEQEGTTIPISGGIMNGSKVISGASEILGLLRTLGEGYRLSCMYRCQEALDVYLKLPHKHYNTGWVLSQIGKAYFELVDYLEADGAFSLARQASPYSLDGMDTYSTVLYHLKEDMKLSYLAQELISTDRLASQSWCAMGNCYSLQKDHETALRNFQRAVQLNPRFAYAHTLCGHEYVALEDFENGIKSYQSALRVDARHYNSWYGLGMIYLRQEKYEFSEHHFQMAFQINTRSSVIMSYLGTALHALKRSDEALVIMEKAILADKKNPLPMYQKANILVSLENFDEALEALEELKEFAPRESSIYALMGKIYKRRNMHDKAMLHFGLALDLKPPATDVATIKAAIEKLHVPDELQDYL